MDESLSPLDRAVLLISTGQDIQKLCVIEQLTKLLKIDQMDTLSRVIPKVCVSLKCTYTTFITIHTLRTIILAMYNHYGIILYSIHRCAYTDTEYTQHIVMPSLSPFHIHKHPLFPHTHTHRACFQVLTRSFNSQQAKRLQSSSRKGWSLYTYTSPPVCPVCSNNWKAGTLVSV